MNIRMKRTAAALCALGMIFALGACTDHEDKDSKKETESSAAQTDSGEEKPADDKTVTDEETTKEEDEKDKDTTDGEDSKTDGITPAMWRIEGENGNTITMLGSMHALTESDYPLPDTVMDAFEAADVLAVECDVESAGTIAFQSTLLKQMYNEDGVKFSDLISGEAYDAVAEYLKTYDMTVDSMELFKPWAVSNTLDSLPVLYSKLDAELGIDAYLLQQAKETDKEIYEVESVEFQMDMLMNFSDEIYDLMFRSLDGESKETMVAQLEELHDAWASGDIEEITELSEEEEEEMSEEDAELAEEYNRIMLTDRNVGMEEAIKEFIEGDKDVFFVVGAAHYVDEGGILDLLEKDGIEYERIEY